jgi:membrane-associated phospholipid phosphatase
MSTILVGSPLAAQSGPAYRAGWQDAVSVGVGGAFALLPVALSLPHGAPPCAPCDPASLWSFDRVAVHHYDATADRGSTLLLVGVGGAAALGSVWGLDRERARGDAAVFVNAVTWAAAADEWVKVLVHRSRPVLYTSAGPAAAGTHENRVSFPSGHAELAFAAATAYTVMAHRQHLPHATRNAILLYAGATVVGVLRVVAAKHFPTDIVGGALLGSGVAWTVATLHP